jgi:hypothetical protein
MEKHKLLLSLGCALAFSWGLFIWPTPYLNELVSEPEKLQTVRDGQYEMVGMERQHLYRITRFTGSVVEVVEPPPVPK